MIIVVNDSEIYDVDIALSYNMRSYGVFIIEVAWDALSLGYMYLDANDLIMDLYDIPCPLTGRDCHYLSMFLMRKRAICTKKGGWHPNYRYVGSKYAKWGCENE